MKALALVWLATLAPFGVAQQPTAGAAAPPQRELLQPVETDATRAGARHVDEQVDAAAKLRKAKQLDAARAQLRAALDEALAVPGREQSGLLNTAIDALGREGILEHDDETQIRAFEPCLAYRLAALGDDHIDVQLTRGNLANAYWQTGDLARGEKLLAQCLDALKRTREPDDELICDTKANLAVVLCKRSDFEGARALMAEAIATYSKKHAATDPDMQWAFSNYANILEALGDDYSALIYREQVHATLSATLPADDADLALARGNLAITLRRSGDPAAARLLLENVLETETKIYPADHRSLDTTRQNLASALTDLGDLQSARILLEGVVARLEARDPANAQGLTRARFTLARVYTNLGEPARALQLCEHVLEIMRDTNGDDHPQTLDAMVAVSIHCEQLGQLERAADLARQVVDTLREKGDEESPDMLNAQLHLARPLARLGRKGEAIELMRNVLAIWTRRLGPGHPSVLIARMALAGLIEDEDREGSLAIIREVAAGVTRQLVTAGEALSPREAELYAGDFTQLIDPVIARCKAQGDAALCFELVEAARSAPLVSARSLRVLDRAAAADAGVLQLRDELRRKSARVAGLAYEGSRADYQAAALERAALEQKLEQAVGKYGGEARASVRAADIAKRLDEKTAAISYRRYCPPSNVAATIVPLAARFAAFVLHGDGSVAHVELGLASELENAFDAWRRALGVGVGASANADEARAAGEALRHLALDPVLAQCGDAQRLVIATDDVLHLVPFDALPRDGGVVGDTLAIELRASLSELTASTPRFEGAHDLIAFGGIDFDAQPPSASKDGGEPAKPVQVALRNGGERMTPQSMHFAPLDASLAEVREIAELYRSRAGEGAHAALFSAAGATKDALAANAARARVLHIATHGFFAPDEIALLGDGGEDPDFSAEVRGLSPRVLCGLAFAGANRPLDFVDRGRGTLTAEELAYLDLDGCELAVLSACDTSAGLRRAGLGIASLQSALHAAGARTTLTSLWQVSDAATRELMLAFYRGIWVDGLPASQALWNAKKTLRDRRAPVRDWAGWVLTGG